MYLNDITSTKPHSRKNFAQIQIIRRTQFATTSSSTLYTISPRKEVHKIIIAIWILYDSISSEIIFRKSCFYLYIVVAFQIWFVKLYIVMRSNITFLFKCSFWLVLCERGIHRYWMMAEVCIYCTIWFTLVNHMNMWKTYFFPCISDFKIVSESIIMANTLRFYCTNWVPIRWWDI